MRQNRIPNNKPLDKSKAQFGIMLKISLIFVAYVFEYTPDGDKIEDEYTILLNMYAV